MNKYILTLAALLLGAGSFAAISAFAIDVKEETHAEVEHAIEEVAEVAHDTIEQSVEEATKEATDTAEHAVEDTTEKTHDTTMKAAQDEAMHETEEHEEKVSH